MPAAHESEPVPAPDSIYTLHVYESLVQLPTLVLNSAHDVFPGLTATSFSIELDGNGSKLHPQRARQEGKDPVTMALFLDDRPGDAQRLVVSLGQQLGELRPDTLNGTDHVSVYAFDCNLVQSVQDLPATASWKEVTKQTLASSALHGPGVPRGHCASASLWDPMAVVVSRLQQLPGRRILVAISDGHNSGGRMSADMLRAFANRAGVTIFGLRPLPVQGSVSGVGDRSRLSAEIAKDDDFGALCGNTGGLLMGSAPGDVAASVERVLHLVRGRYILEFPRPAEQRAGQHSLSVELKQPSAIVRWGGFMIPSGGLPATEPDGQLPGPALQAPVPKRSAPH